MGRRLLALAAVLSALVLAISCGGGMVEISGLSLLDADGNAWEDPSLEMEVGDSRSLSVSVTPENATYKDALLWSSTDDSVATVSASGKVTVLKAGTASVAVRSATGGEASASVSVTVRAKAVPAEAVELGDSELAIGIGSSRLIAAALAPAGAAGTIEWSSTDESVATVDGTGLVTAHKAGTATIRAKAGEAEAECRVSAVEPYIKFSSPAKFALSSSAGYKYWTGKVEWSHDGEAWTEWDGRAAVDSTDPADGQSVLLVRGDGFCAGYTATTNSMHWTLTPSGGASDKVSCSGDIRTLIDHSVPSDAVLTDCCFAFLFLDCASLDSAPALPSETLAAYCYQNMFYNCRNLASAPAELPAETLAEYCYSYMFNNCSSLASAPALPAKTLAAYCYAYMFDGCSKLASAPALSATTLAEYCYQYMFNGCSLLKFYEVNADGYNKILDLTSLTTSPSGAFSSMFSGTGGDFKGVPTVGKSYYTSNDIVTAGSGS